MSIWFDFGVDWKIRGYEFVVYQMCGRSLYETGAFNTYDMSL